LAQCRLEIGLGLVFGQICRHANCAMMLLPIRRVLIGLLAAFLALGLTMSVAQATDMAMKMSTSSGMTASQNGDCHDCDGDDAGKTKMMVCAAVCYGPVLAAFAEVAPVLVLRISAAIIAPEDILPRGNPFPPDPYPPRSVDIA
jgi:hypothetical protein